MADNFNESPKTTLNDFTSQIKKEGLAIVNRYAVVLAYPILLKQFPQHVGSHLIKANDVSLKRSELTADSVISDVMLEHIFELGLIATAPGIEKHVQGCNAQWGAEDGWLHIHVSLSKLPPIGTRGEFPSRSHVYNSTLPWRLRTSPSKSISH